MDWQCKSDRDTVAEHGDKRNRSSESELVYHKVNICQRTNKSFGCWRLEMGKLEDVADSGERDGSRLFGER